MTNTQLKALFKTHKEDSLFGRFIHTQHIKPLLEKHKNSFEIRSIGESVLGETIYSIMLGSGSKKILMWSQMHGNESTTTKAVFDLLNVLGNENEFSKSVLKHCTVVIIPILNPDGAKAYTRINANAVDLNRDAQNLSQPESKVLKDVFNNFSPHFCFNLHGQRTIFSAGKTDNVASVSFLSPAQDETCAVTENREVAMSIINNMNVMLQNEIPNQVGIYDDAYNINCVGDTFQTLNVPTVLFEAGHYKDDYNREVVRRFIFQSLAVAIQSIALNTIKPNSYDLYSKIPQNEKCFYDIIIRSARFGNKIIDMAIQYDECLRDNSIKFIPKIKKIKKLNDFYAHRVIEANKHAVLDVDGKELILENEIDFVSISNVKFSLKIT